MRNTRTVTQPPYRWVPPGLDEQEARSFLELQQGIPWTARGALGRAMMENKRDHDYASWAFAEAFEVASGFYFGINHPGVMQVRDALHYFSQLDELTFTHLLDFALSRHHKVSPGYAPPSLATTVSQILGDCGSKWAVGGRGGRYGLVERLPSGVVTVAEGVVSREAEAGGLLSRAWQNAFGLNPSASHAYIDAVRAVEVLANPLISPKDTSATLGKDINVLRGQPGDWTFALRGFGADRTVDQVLGMMQLLWHSQSDRHGAASYSDPDPRVAVA